MRATVRPVTPGWVAGSIRARGMLSRRLGRDEAFRLAGSASLDEALASLSATAYGRAVRPRSDLAAAERAVAETVLWHLRVLAGWVPPRALETARAFAAWFELSNIDERLAYLAGEQTPRPFVLGGLATAWPQLADAQSAAELRARLAGSPWGDPGGEQPIAIGVGLRLAWARRVIASVAEAADWVAGAVALLLARELMLAGRPAADLARQRPPGVGSLWMQAQSIETLRAALPAAAAWPLEGIAEPRELWRAEAAWWRRVEQEAERLVHEGAIGRSIVVGAIVLLAVDGWRTTGALEIAARGGDRGAMEVFEEIA